MYRLVIHAGITDYVKDVVETIIKGIIDIIKSFIDMVTSPVTGYFHAWKVAANSCGTFGIAAPVVYLIMIVASLLILIWFGKHLPIIGEFFKDDE